MRVSLLLGAPFVLSAALVACAASRPSPAASTTLSSATAEPCRGAQFDADDPDPRCLRNHASAPTPSPKALHVSLHADSVAKSGHEAVLVLEMRNVSGDPLELDVDGACAFDAVATNGDVTSFETDCGGLCGHGPESGILHVTLDPDGVIVKRVHFYASQIKVVATDHERCEQHSAGGLPPGRYKVTVSLPWADPSPDNPGTLVARSVDLPLTVTP